MMWTKGIIFGLLRWDDITNIRQYRYVLPIPKKSMRKRNSTRTVKCKFNSQYHSIPMSVFWELTIHATGRVEICQCYNSYRKKYSGHSSHCLIRYHWPFVPIAVNVERITQYLEVGTFSINRIHFRFQLELPGHHFHCYTIFFNSKNVFSQRYWCVCRRIYSHTI